MIVCGTVLIAMPYIYSTVSMQQVTTTMVALNKPVNLTADLPKYADVTSMICGILMVIVGAIAGLSSRRNEQTQTQAQ